MSSDGNESWFVRLRNANILAGENQKAYDLEITAAEYRSALEIYHRVEEQSVYNPNIPDPSLFLARL